MKINKKETYCKCGKELSEEEIKKGKTCCENCIGKKVSKVKKILKGTTTILVGIGSIAGGIAMFLATRGKKGKF